MRKNARYRLLIADDSAVCRGSLFEELYSAGFRRIVMAEDGAIAVEKAKEGQFDLVLLDIRMPHLGGIEAVEQIRKLHGYDAIPIFALTAEANPRLIQEGKRAGFNGWFIKPFRLDPMLRGIQQLLDRFAA